jgi:hypothetical protein
MAVATHISKNDDIDRASYTVDNDSVNGEAGRFDAYKINGLAYHMMIWFLNIGIGTSR